jgi:hypothetical protein
MQAGNSVTTNLIERIGNEIIKLLWNGDNIGSAPTTDENKRA